MKINAAGRTIIKLFEGLRLEAYRCPAGIWTIAYGHTGDVKQGDKVTEHQADVILGLDLERFENEVSGLLWNGANENQFSAFVSLAYNIGIATFVDSRLLKKFLMDEACADEFLRWTRGGGKVLSGLARRRQAERDLFLTPVLK